MCLDGLTKRRDSLLGFPVLDPAFGKGILLKEARALNNDRYFRFTSRSVTSCQYGTTHSTLMNVKRRRLDIECNCDKNEQGIAD